MNTTQALAFGVLGGMMLLFIWGKLRYDMVAVLALLASIALGTVSADKAFLGFSDDIVIIVGSALVVSAAIERSGVIESVLGWIGGRVTKLQWQLTILVGSVTILSALVKNIGALAMLMPAAIKMARRANNSPSALLMPMAFGSLLGGLITLVGTSPNIIVSRVREQMTGEPFGMFDYAPVGIGLSIVGLIFLRFGYRLLPSDRRAAPTMGEALDISDYHTEALVREDSDAVGLTVAEFVAKNDGEVRVAAIVRADGSWVSPWRGSDIRDGDTLLMQGEPDALERAIATGGLTLEGEERTAATDTPAGERGVIEAVVTGTSPLIGEAAGDIGLHAHYGINLIAISRKGARLTDRLGKIVLMAGDVVVLQGPLALLPQQLRELGCLPLAERAIRLGNVRRGLLPVAILALAMALTATGVLPVAIAFFGAAAAMVLTGSLPIREAYERIEWPILIMLGALIPVSGALQETGATDIVSTWLSQTAATLPVWGAVALILVTAMAVTPFLNNAATVLVMAPIAATFAGELGYRPEPFLMAVAVGAGCDFLTPIGHQCNTLVMSVGGYRFGDYARLGAPLSLLVIGVGVPLILAVWPAV